MMCMKLLKPFIVSVSQPHDSITKKDVRDLSCPEDNWNDWTHTFELFFCFHCCFSFSKIKLSCFLGVLSAGAGCGEDVCTSLWTAADESSGMSIGLMVHTAERGESQSECQRSNVGGKMQNIAMKMLCLLHVIWLYLCETCWARPSLH